MNSIDFCYWLQGYFEVSGQEKMTEAQMRVVKNHLNLVFKHEIDPLREEQTPTPTAVLNTAHTGLGPIMPNDALVRC